MGATATRRAPSAIALSATVLGVVALAAAATAVQGIPTFSPPSETPDLAGPSAVPSPALLPPLPTMEPSPPPAPPDLSAVQDVAWILIALAIAVAVALLIRVLASRAAARRVTAPLPPPDSISSSGVEATAEPESILRGIDGALLALRSDRVSSEAILAAWIGLEEAAVDSGLRRGVTETPAEFAMRIITRTTDVRDAASVLLDRYQRVRFGGETATASDRAACVEALVTIRAAWR